MPIFARYLLFQLPAWALAAVILGALTTWAGVPTALSAIVFAAIVIKDFVAYPFVRSAYEPGTRTGSARLIGCAGTARSLLDPVGYVRVGSELWKARLADGEGAVAEGQSVVVVDSSGLTLVVRSAMEADGELRLAADVD